MWHGSGYSSVVPAWHRETEIMVSTQRSPRQIPLKAQAGYYTLFQNLFSWFNYFISVFWRESNFFFDLFSFFAGFVPLKK